VEVENLFFQIRVKILAVHAGVDKIGRDMDNLVLYSEALENMDRKMLERRLRLALGKISAEDLSFVPADAARVGRRAIYLPIDDWASGTTCCYARCRLWPWIAQYRVTSGRWRVGVLCPVPASPWSVVAKMDWPR